MTPQQPQIFCLTSSNPNFSRIRANFATDWVLALVISICERGTRVNFPLMFELTELMEFYAYVSQTALETAFILAFSDFQNSRDFFFILCFNNLNTFLIKIDVLDAKKIEFLKCKFIYVIFLSFGPNIDHTSFALKMSNVDFMNMSESTSFTTLFT